MNIARLLVPFGLVLLTGCPFTGPDCILEYRSVTLEETFDGGIRVYIALDEQRDAGSDHVTSRRMTWAVTGQLGADVLIGIHLHRGISGPVIATIPIQNTRGSVVLTDGDVVEPQFLMVSYDEFFAALRTQPIYVDLHTVENPAGRTLGRLLVKYDNPWVHPYCS